MQQQQRRLKKELEAEKKCAFQQMLLSLIRIPFFVFFYFES